MRSVARLTIQLRSYVRQSSILCFPVRAPTGLTTTIDWDGESSKWSLSQQCKTVLKAIRICTMSLCSAPVLPLPLPQMKLCPLKSQVGKYHFTLSQMGTPGEHTRNPLFNILLFIVLVMSGTLLAQRAHAAHDYEHLSSLAGYHSNIMQLKVLTRQSTSMHNFVI